MPILSAFLNEALPHALTLPETTPDAASFGIHWPILHPAARLLTTRDQNHLAQRQQLR